MELWVRSQDKTILSKAHNLIVRENQNENNETNYAIVDIYTMGIYKTIERALEVLDDIESLLCGNSRIKGLVKSIGIRSENTKLLIYEMPKE